MSRSKIIRWSAFGLGSLVALWFVISTVVLILTPGSVFDNKVSWAPIPNYGYELNFIKLDDGHKVSLWTLPNKSQKTVILYLHGNTGRINDMIVELSKYGTVYSPSYPGYGESEGSPTSQAVYETALKTYDYITKVKGIDESNVIILGHSMGGSPAVYLAGQRPNAHKLVLANTFSSVQSMCFRQYSIFCAFTGGIFNTAENAKKVTIPVRQFAYEGDTSVPYTEGQKLFEYFSSSNDKRFVSLNNYTHVYLDFNEVGKELVVN